jgi:hypothetical protein
MQAEMINAVRVVTFFMLQYLSATQCSNFDALMNISEHLLIRVFKIKSIPSSEARDDIHVHLIYA